MMKKQILMLLAVVFSITVSAQEDFTIQVNDTTFGLEIDKGYSVMIDGKKVNIKVTAKDTLLYDDALFSFKYPKEYKPSKMVLDGGIEQIMLITAAGSGVIFQKYDNLNPSILNELMLSEVTKESVSYGYELTRDDYSRKLKSGQMVDVDKAILTYKGEKGIYEVASIGKKDEGIIIMTVVSDETLSVEGKRLIDFVWGSLVYK